MASRSQKTGGVILLLPPQFIMVKPHIDQTMRLHGMTHFEEIEPKAGCRRFRLFKETDERRQASGTKKPRRTR